MLLSEELKLRLISGIIMFIIVALIAILGGIFYNIAILLISLFCTAELFIILSKNNNEVSKNTIYKGILAIILPAVSLMIIRNTFINGLQTLFWFFILIACVDVFAYFTGKLIGRVKIAPTISPSKTYEGLFGGVIVAVLFSASCYHFFHSQFNFVIYIIFSIIIAILAQVSDMCESFLKRKYEVKDSSNLIPGHGGFLDRLDGYFLTAPFVVIMYFFSYIFFSIPIFG